MKKAPGFKMKPAHANNGGQKVQLGKTVAKHAGKPKKLSRVSKAGY